MIIPTPKLTNLLILFSVIGLMAYALYTQYFQYLEPCPLCITQRLFYCLIGALVLLALLHNNGSRIYTGLASLSGIGGIAAAGRQVWLQHLPPDQVPACGPGLHYMLETFPLSETLRTMITGDGNCAEVTWSFLGFSMGEWSLLCFIGLTSLCLWQTFRAQSTST